MAKRRDEEDRGPFRRWTESYPLARGMYEPYYMPVAWLDDVQGGMGVSVVGGQEKGARQKISASELKSCVHGRLAVRALMICRGRLRKSSRRAPSTSLHTFTRHSHS